jgi:hypothetical protein
MNIFIYQIFYDDLSRKKVLPEFIPLDNSRSERPDWFEFWPILNFLRKNTLLDDAWYGFLSPKFTDKTGFDHNYVFKAIEKHAAQCDVALFSPAWDQLAYFLNPFEQGEIIHPGLMDLSQDFINHNGMKLNLNSLVTDSYSSVFSNYIVAKKEFWVKWMKIAESFFEYAEISEKHKVFTTHKGISNVYPMKVFIQERLASVVLATGAFQVYSPDQSLHGPINPLFFISCDQTRRLLQSCDLMKSCYRESIDEAYLKMYWTLRKNMNNFLNG